MARLFVAVIPPEEVRDLLAALDRSSPAVRWVAPDCWHVTLLFLGDVASHEARLRLDSTELPAATATAGPRVETLGRRAVVVPVAGLDGLAASITTAMTGLSMTSDRRRFEGHLTLGRKRDAAACPLIGTPIDVTFQVREVALVSSRLTTSGPDYRTVGVWSTTPTTPTT